MYENPIDSEANQPSFEKAMGFDTATASESPPAYPPARTGLFGLSAAQRLVLSLLVLMAVCVLGTMCLLITGRITAF
jgi:hypothetical protein